MSEAPHFEAELAFNSGFVWQVCFSRDDLMVCSSCSSVSFCSEHKAGASGHDTVACEKHLIRLAAAGLSAKLGGVTHRASSLVVEDEAEVLTDWSAYFAARRSHFGTPEAEIRALGLPWESLLRDGLSAPLTIAMQLQRLGVSVGAVLRVHMLGAEAEEEARWRCFEELLHLFPQVTTLELLLVGPDVAKQRAGGEEVPLCEACVRQGRRFVVESQRMAYHDWRLAQRDFKTPTIAMAQHSGLHEEYSRSDGKAASFQAMWAPTIECLARGGFPTILTGFTGLEMDQDAACLLEWGAEIVVEPTENPFCGRR